MVPAASHRQWARGDRGITIILFAVAMVGIITIVALVIDYSNVRNARQENKLTSDVVVTAGLQELAPDGIPRPWRGVCSALAYLEVNEPDRDLTITYMDGSEAAVGGDPCTSLVNQECTADPSTWAWIRAVDGDFVVDIRSGYVTPDAEFAEDAAEYSGDDGTGEGCDQLAVINSNSNPVLFGGIVGKTSYDTRSRSVGRVTIGSDPTDAPAFLILERTDCNVLTNSVGTQGTSRGIIIRSPDGLQAGLAHVDSNATGSNCSGSARAVVATPLPDGTPSLTVDSNADGSQQGTIAINALSAGGDPDHAYRSYPDGMSVQPTPGQIVSRAPVDEKYNPTSAQTISSIHAAAREAVVAGGAPAGTTHAYSCPVGDIEGTHVYISCATFNPNPGATFPDALSVTFSGNVAPGNNRSISFPQASRIVIRGQLAGGQRGIISAPRVEEIYVGGGVALNGGDHDFSVNSTSSTSCVGGTSAATRFVIFGGNLALGGRASLCSTFVYLAGPTSLTSYQRQMVDSGGSCSPTRPCPKAVSNAVTGAALLVEGGRVIWSAPNQFVDAPPPGSQGIEDLALWTESATKSEVKSNGTVEATGVFFLPNAHVGFSSPTVAQPRNAQFIARSLELLQGTLEMRPVKTDSIVIPRLDGTGLVR